MQIGIHFIFYLAQFFLEWEVFQTKVVEKSKHFQKSCCLIMWKNIAEPGGTQMTVLCIRIACWIPKAYNRTLRIRNTYCFSTAAMVACMCLSVILYIHCLTLFIYIQYLDATGIFRFHLKPNVGSRASSRHVHIWFGLIDHKSCWCWVFTAGHLLDVCCTVVTFCHKVLLSLMYKLSS
jgi:hypothetical protein